MPAPKRSTRRDTSFAHSRTYEIVATEEIINNAVVRDSGHCVWADAVAAALPQMRRISVDLQTIRFTDPRDGNRYVYLTPAVAQRSLVQFDQGTKPLPGETIRLTRSNLAQIITRSPETRDRKRTRNTKARVERGDSHVPTGAAYIMAGDTQGTPVKMEGKAPPTAALSNRTGRRRTFGLKTLEP